MLFTPGKQYVFEYELLLLLGAASAHSMQPALPAGQSSAAWVISQCLTRCSLEELSLYPK